MKIIKRFEDGIELNEDVDYISSVNIHNTPVNIYISDYGQCFFFTYKNKQNEIEEIGCGSYNSDYLECIAASLDPKGFHISTEGEQYWDQIVSMRKSRGLESLDYDDYEIYDFNEMYKMIKEDK